MKEPWQGLKGMECVALCNRTLSKAEKPDKGKMEVRNVGTVNGYKLTREDLSEFTYTEISEKRYIRQMPFLSNGK